MSTPKGLKVETMAGLVPGVQDKPCKARNVLLVGAGKIGIRLSNDTFLHASRSHRVTQAEWNDAKLGTKLYLGKKQSALNSYL